MPSKPQVAAALVKLEAIEHQILTLRGHKVLLSHDLAALYGVETKALVQAVKRNIARFPSDFMFQLSAEEVAALRSQFVTSSWGGQRYLPYAFTQEGVAMLSSVLRSAQAVKVNIEIMRAFVRMRRVLETHREWARKLEELEKKIGGHDEALRLIFDALKQLMAPEVKEKRRIGFKEKGEK